MMPRPLGLILALAIVACQGSGVTDAERVWCTDHPEEIVAAAATLNLYKPLDLPTPSNWTYAEFLDAVKAARIDWIYEYSSRTGYLGRLKSGEAFNLDVAEDRIPDEANFEAQVRAAQRNGGLPEGALTRLTDLNQPLTQGDQDRACKAAFASR